MFSFICEVGFIFLDTTIKSFPLDILKLLTIIIKERLMALKLIGKLEYFLNCLFYCNKQYLFEKVGK